MCSEIEQCLPILPESPLPAFWGVNQPLCPCELAAQSVSEDEVEAESFPLSFAIYLSDGRSLDCAERTFMLYGSPTWWGRPGGETYVM